MVPCHTIPSIPHQTVPYHNISYHSIPCHTIPCHPTPHHTMSHRTIPHHALPYRILYHRPYYTKLYQTMPYKVVLHHTTPYPQEVETLVVKRRPWREMIFLKNEEMKKYSTTVVVRTFHVPVPRYSAKQEIRHKQ